MKRKMTRFLAIVLIGIMTTSVLPTINVRAENAVNSLEETIGAVENNTSESEEIKQEITEESSAESVEEEMVALADGSNADSPELNYLYINKTYIEEEEIQDIVVSWGNENQEIIHMVLNLSNESGQIISLEGTKYEAETVLFSSVFERGIYQIIGLEVTTDTTKEVTMEEYGISAFFGVGEEYSGEKSECIEMESVDESLDADVEFAVANLDENNMDSNAEEIAETLAMVDTSSVATMSLENETGVVTTSDDGNLVIVLDPGHDSKHIGAQGNGVSEEVATLKIAKYCQEELEKYAGVTVYLTREDESCPFPETVGPSDGNILDIKKRVDWAKTKGADVFISIHLNSFDNSAVNGAEVYYPTQSTEGKNLAQKIQSELVSLGLYNRGIKAGDVYAVISSSVAAGFPGIIIEHAFVSNASDTSNYLSSDEKLKKLGIADANGIVKYYGLQKDELENGGWKTDSAGNVYYYENGIKVYGEKSIAGKWYHFDEKTGVMTTGWYDFPHKRVYYGNNGAMVYGEKSINGKWYYFNKETGAMTTGWYNLPTKMVYYSPEGFMVYGEQSIDGKWYYFNKETGAMATGWYDLPNKRVYYGEDGAMVYGEKSIDGKWYYFNKETGAMVTGWHDFPHKRVYYGEDGAMVYGEKSIDGKWYHFNEVDGAMTTGWYDFPHKRVYYDNNGIMVYGIQEIDGKMYEFDSITGALLNEKKEEQGEVCIDGKWYYIDENGNKITGWHDFPHKRVYYGEDGAMIYGEKSIDGKWYYFDKETGAVVTLKWVDGKFYGEDGIWIEDVSKVFYKIEGSTTTNVEQMVKFYEENSPIDYPSEVLEKGGAATITDFATIFFEEANAENIKAEVAWAQTMLETGFLKFGGQVKIEQFNFAGLGATDGGASGADFSLYGTEGVRMGVRAQIQHLKAYASSGITLEGLYYECVDPRFTLVSPKGCAEYVETLGQQENPNGKGWATGVKYGFNIRKMIDLLKET